MTHNTANTQTVEFYTADTADTAPTNDPGDALEPAFTWGQEDAIEGNQMAGGMYFVMCSPEWHSYNDGYAAGLRMRNMLGTELPGDAMSLSALDSFDALDAQRADERYEAHRQQCPFQY